MYEHGISLFKFSLFSSELNELLNVCISVTTPVATESNDNVNIGVLAGGVSAGLIFILVITVLLVLICTCIPRFRRSKIIDSVSTCVCVFVQWHSKGVARCTKTIPCLIMPFGLPSK